MFAELHIRVLADGSSWKRTAPVESLLWVLERGFFDQQGVEGVLRIKVRLQVDRL